MRATSRTVNDARIYLDWNATTPPLDAVVAAMVDVARAAWGNPSSVHAVGRSARGRVEDAREAVAALMHCDPRDVVFTSGGTEANNLALRTGWNEGGVLVTSRLEHPSISRVAEMLERDGGTRVRWLRVREEGTIDLADLEAALAEGDVRLVALQAVNHETGVVQPVDEAIALAHRHGARVHVDAVQAVGRVDAIGVAADTRSIAAHKIRGPKGIGALVTRSGARIDPVVVGGSQERGVRPGTLDAVAASGFAVAVRHAVDGASRYRAIAALRDELERALLATLPGSSVNGVAARAPHVTNIVCRGWGGPELVAALDLEGVCASSGSACSAGTAEPSPVLAAMFGDDARASSSLRFSLGETTTRDDVTAAISAFVRVVARDKNAP